MVLIEIVFYLINIIIALTIALMEKRDISAAWAWLFVMLLLPGIGFIIYLFLAGS
ncbi:Major cardiolipin synthase ClsA [Pediococcus pentosaceus]|uniref:Major cardiolipin synthase ClsA n=1 Tax=Pediococcus pentosaceus TaxID=1255 RepID=A0A1Y0VMJ3_PEDPE|nr:Major cardiolipin synthase ClsA [Pediococcus pentosaceus]